MDTEGTDSNQRRNEDYQIFERVVTCFTFSMSDVLLINAKWDEIERRNGSNINLLKVIITAHQNLFANEADVKKKLIFLVRDSKENKIQRDKIIESLIQKLKENWELIAKNKKSSFDDFFVVDFIFLSSNENKNFDNEIDNLREKLAFKSKDSIFIKDKNSKLNFADLPEYYDICLSKILNENELSLTNEQNAIHESRCKSIRKQIISFIKRKLEKLNNMIFMPLHL